MRDVLEQFPGAQRTLFFNQRQQQCLGFFRLPKNAQATGQFVPRGEQLGLEEEGVMPLVRVDRDVPALKAGALDFIEKPVDNERLVELVEAAMTKDAEAAQRQEQAALLAGRLQRLTQREREVMEQVVAGRHNREIAADLGISPRTVEVYKARLMDKLDVRRVADLVKLALEAQADSGT